LVEPAVGAVTRESGSGLPTVAVVLVEDVAALVDVAAVVGDVPVALVVVAAAVVLGGSGRVVAVDDGSPPGTRSQEVQ
jgi:hypothetical protein